MGATAAAGLRAWAKGDYPQEAGIELLVRAFDGQYAQTGCPWVKPCDRPGWWWLDVATLLDYQGVCSGGERRVLSVVAALVDGRPVVDLGDVIAGLDRDNVQLVLAALSHAAGAHDQAELVRLGDQLVFAPLPALVGWPATRFRRAA